MRVGADDTTYIRVNAVDSDAGTNAFDFGCGGTVGPSAFAAISSTGTCLWQFSEPTGKDPAALDVTPEGLLAVHGTQLEILAQATGKVAATFNVGSFNLFASSAKTSAIYAYGVDSNQVPFLARIR